MRGFTSEDFLELYGLTKEEFLEREANPQVGDIYGCSGNGHIIMLLASEDCWTGISGYVSEVIWHYCDLEGTENQRHHDCLLGKRIKTIKLDRSYDLLFPFDFDEKPAKV